MPMILYDIHIYMLFSLLLSFSGILRCPCIVIIATPLSKFCDDFAESRRHPRWVNSDEGGKNAKEVLGLADSAVVLS